MTNGQELFGKTLDEIEQERKQDIVKAEQEERVRAAEAAKKAEAEKARAATAKFPDGEEITPKSLIEKIVSLHDFSRIKEEFNSIPDLNNRIMYIDRVVAERVPDGLPMVLYSTDKEKAFHYLLREIGMPLLCPFYSPHKEGHIFETCTIESKPIDAICGGRNDICKVFADNVQRAARGEIQLNFPSAMQDQPSKECLVDLEELEDCWTGGDD